jgi:dCMP deaminase
MSEVLEVKKVRKSWDAYFMSIAEKAAERSTCDRANVGCVLVKENKLLSTGYNGSIKGHDHCDDIGHLLNDQGRCIRTIHAEQNAFAFADREELKGSTAYVTHEPCENCTKLLVQAGIIRIVFKKKYFNKFNHHFIGNTEWVHFEDEPIEVELN